jgi:Tfp pilus assembly protein PilZ
VPPEDVLRKLRIPFVRKATLEHGGQREEVFVIDVAVEGLFVERAQPLPVGGEVTLRMRLPGNELPFTALCRVAWWHPGEAPLTSKSLPAGLGLEIVEASEVDRNRLREHIEEYCRQDPSVRRFLRHWPEAERKGDDP